MKHNLLQPDRVKKNFAFQIIYQVVILVIPLIVSPYLTRTMGSIALGTYTYTYSIAYYFVVFAMLGINKHGQRIIAQRRNDSEKLRTTFWSLYFIHAVASILSLAAYLVYVLVICGSDKEIALIQGIYVFSATLDITWLFYGLEKFKIVSIRNAIIKLIETFCIFMFVKSLSDLGVYTLIMTLSICIGQTVMLPQAVSAISPIHLSKEDLVEHIKPLFTLFAAVVAATLYTMFDKTLIGILSTTENVAFYEYSDKIVKIPRTFITVIGTVLFPKACRYAAANDKQGMKITMDNCLIVAYFIGFAAFFGLLSVADLFATTYYGDEFAICGTVMMSMSPLILIIGIGESVRSCYIYPLKRDTAMVKILTANAVINLVLSSLLIPKIGIYGAVAGTVVAELCGLICEMCICRRYIVFKSFIAKGVPFSAIGLVMFIVIRIAADFMEISVSSLLIQILIGASVYLFLSFVYCYCLNSTTKQIIIGIKNKTKVKLRKV